MAYSRCLIMKNKPRIRFKGFAEDWEQRELSSLTEYIGTGKSQFAIKEFGEYAILGSTNVIGYDDAYDYDGNFILTARVGANAGQLYQYSGKVKITDNTVFLMSDRSQFIYYTLTHFDLRRLSFGTGQPLVKSSELQKLKLCVPVSKSEQEKIGEIFNNIDNIITLHQRKLEKLKLAKKALLQKLFPKNGSQFPEIRFKGFTDAWEQHKLGDLYKRVNERNDGTLGRDKWISVAKMYFQDPDKVQSNNLDTRTYVMKKGDIAFEGHPNNEFRFGRFVLNDIGTGIISELFPIYRPITEYDLDFWKYAIQLERVMAPIFAKSITSSGNSSNKLDHNHFLNQELLVPNIEEQKKIGTLLSILSKNITLHQRKLDKLQEVKKGLLQKMFV